jgi:hypothetical protein
MYRLIKATLLNKSLIYHKAFLLPYQLRCREDPKLLASS